MSKTAKFGKKIQGILGVNMLKAFLHSLGKSKFLCAYIQPYGFFFIGLYKAFLHSLCKSKFLCAYIQPYGFFFIGLYMSFEVDSVFFCF
jgi:hypothetical protein